MEMLCQHSTGTGTLEMHAILVFNDAATAMVSTLNMPLGPSLELSNDELRWKAGHAK